MPRHQPAKRSIRTAIAPLAKSLNTVGPAYLLCGQE
jgi:hypothetical protein